VGWIVVAWYSVEVVDMDYGAHSVEPGEVGDVSAPGKFVGTPCAARRNGAVEVFPQDESVAGDVSSRVGEGVFEGSEADVTSGVLAVDCEAREWVNHLSPR
jgi:hypothetical protein